MEARIRYTALGKGSSVREKMIKGAIEAAEMVTMTLGPSGHTVVIHAGDGEPVVTQDGVTVARSMLLPDPLENIGAQLIKQVANRTQSKAGDGTTTATLLAMSIFQNLKKIDGHSSVAVIKEGMNAAANDIVQHLDAHQIDIDIDTEEGMSILEKVAFISANNDTMISDLIMKAVRNSKGKNPIKINKAKDNKCYVQTLEGMVYYNSVHHEYFLEGLSVAGEISLKRARFFITDHEITSLMDLKLPLDYYMDCEGDNDKSFQLVIIAPDFSKEAINHLLQQMFMFKQRGAKMEIFAVKAPGFGNEQSNMLKDIAVFTGAIPVLKSNFEELQDVGEYTADQILGTGEMSLKRDEYAILNGKYDQKEMDDRIHYLNELIEEEESMHMAEKYMQRKAKLMGNISIIFVGAETDVEANEIHDRVDDAVNAVKGAIADGVVRGGGVALLQAHHDFSRLREDDDEHLKKGFDFLMGYSAVLEACKSPFAKILLNGEVDTQKASDVVYMSNFKKMINVRTREKVDILEEKILDPLRVTKNAVKAAVSVVSTIMSTEGSITTATKKME